MAAASIALAKSTKEEGKAKGEREKAFEEAKRILREQDKEYMEFVGTSWEVEEPERVKRGVDVEESDHLAPRLGQEFATAKLEVNCTQSRNIRGRLRRDVADVRTTDERHWASLEPELFKIYSEYRGPLDITTQERHEIRRICVAELDADEVLEIIIPGEGLWPA